MKLFRKAMAMLSASAIVLGLMAAPAAAATGSTSAADDVKGTKYEEAVGRLGALSILKGYPDGTFKPDGKITRAEFAAVTVRSLGLESAGAAQKGTTRFSDVAADHWASGYVNIATSQGIIKGYPDGTFHPEAEVTYAEASAMLVRLVGYEPLVKGEWPANYVSKAGELGITNSVALNVNAPAVRGDVAIMTDNTLEVDIIDAVSYDGEKVTYEKTPGRNLLTEKLGLTRLIGNVTMTPRVSNGTLDSNEITLSVDSADEARDTDTYVTGRSYTLKVADGVDANSLLSYDVTLLVQVNKKTNQDDDVVLHATVDTRSSDIVVDKVNYFWNDKINLIYSGKAYGFAADATIYYNNIKLTDLATLQGMYHGGAPDVKIILNASGDVQFYEETEMYFNSAFVTSVRAADEKILFEGLVPQTPSGSITAGTLSLAGETYSIVKNGKAIALSDVKAGDMIYVVTAASLDRPTTDADFYYIVVTDGKTVEGTVTEVYGSDAVQTYKVKIGDTEYKVSRDATFSQDGNDTYEPFWSNIPALEDFINEKVTAYIGFDGRIRHIMTDESSDDQVGVVNEGPWQATSASGRQIFVELLKNNGVAATYEITDDTIVVNGGANQNDVDAVTWFGLHAADFAAGTVVDYTLASDGTLDELYVGSIAAGMTKTEAALTAAMVDDDDNRIQVGGVWYLVTSETAVFDASDVADIAATTWSAVEDHNWQAGESWAVTAVVDEDNDPQLKGLVITGITGGTGLGSSTDIAMVTRKTLTTDGWKLTVDVGGTTYTYTVDDSAVVDAVYSDDNIGDAVLWVPGTSTLNGAIKNIEPWDIISFDLNSSGEIERIEEFGATYGTINSVSISNLLKIDEYSYDGVAFTATGSTKSFVVNEDTQYYDLSSYTITRTSFDKLSKGLDVMVIDFDGDGIADAVKIFNFGDYEA